MKITVMSDGFPPYRRGGAETVAHGITTEYVRQGHDVSVLTTVQTTDEVGSETTAGPEIHKVYASYHHRWTAYRGLYNPQSVRAVREILPKLRPDVIHVHNIHRYLSYHCVKVASDLNIPVALTLHDAMSFDYGKFTGFVDPGDLSDQPRTAYRLSRFRTLMRYRFRYFPLRNLLIRWYLHHFATERITVSRELGAVLKANGVESTRTVHNGVDLKDFTATEQDREEFSRAHGLLNRKLVLFGGRLSYAKGGQQLLQAMKRVVSRVPEAVLLVLGHLEGPGDHMVAMAKEMGIEKHTAFPGWLTGQQLRAAYAASDVVAVPSVAWDSFPTANLEAMAMRKPVVGTVFGGTKEIVVDGETGYIVNPLNVERLASRIIELLSDEQKAKAMGEAGYRRVLDNFTIQRSAGRYIEVLEGLLEKKAAAAWRA